ncbi:MAG: hypothetical protein AVDCRST_MAG22-1516 [uncultured Rubrobacteraceae bacterium]|uniref:Uncharacterized protein n=1 Tax=uncultured Rubrobacteraceae bacterium TaxID=349277 RepID=A0A6J4P3S4_9ACTN|nr:MAG: hypothetical protein AVDCRST_MAG22-1516 [uncultured Rubrobacteraceae bacterium]
MTFSTYTRLLWGLESASDGRLAVPLFLNLLPSSRDHPEGHAVEVFVAVA